MKFKYRPTVESIDDLQPGDEFLVGDERWEWDSTTCLVAGGNPQMWHGPCIARNLIRANVPIERDIPYPEGGAEKWELRYGDGDEDFPPCEVWDTDHWRQFGGGYLWTGHIYAISKAKPAPKEYTVLNGMAANCIYLDLDDEIQPGDHVTIQKVPNETT
jgi:hypothetical protein